MNPRPHGGRTRGACAACRRRGWLLGALGGVLDFRARDWRALLRVLAMPDAELLEALAGTRMQELRARYEAVDAEGGEHWPYGSTCRHSRAFPTALDGPASPHMLTFAPGAGGLHELTAPLVVAILGHPRASDYGTEMARSFARGLTARGCSAVAVLTDGIAAAAHAGALETGGPSIAVLGGGLDVGCPATLAGLYRQIVRHGCAISELPPGCAGRRWGALAAERTVVELAQAVLVVEAPDTPRALAAARMAQARDIPLAALPGRVTSPFSSGTHELLREGARLVRGPEDVLELAAGAPGASPAGPPERREHDSATKRVALAPELRATFERVGNGWDRPESLTCEGGDPWETLQRLTELELMGLLVRGHGGRYVVGEPLTELVQAGAIGGPTGRESQEGPPRRRIST